VPTVHSLRLTKCRESSYLTLCCTEPQKIGWLLILTEINQVALKCPGIKRTPISCPEEAVQILWKSYEEYNCDMWGQRCVFFLTSLPGIALRFSLLALIFRTVLNWITSRRFQPHLPKPHLKGGEPPPPGKSNVKFGHLLSLYFGYIFLSFLSRLFFCVYRNIFRWFRVLV